MRSPLSIWSTSILFSLATAVCAMGACSLGTAKVPDCDAQADPGTPGACQQVAACDDGTGYPMPTDECCSKFAANTYAECSGQTIDEPTCIHAVCVSLDAALLRPGARPAKRTTGAAASRSRTTGSACAESSVLTTRAAAPARRADKAELPRPAAPAAEGDAGAGVLAGAG
jgi:hypothetical protein